jgi:pimeloyl-ACP methyl ester carboxylesterase
MKRWPATVERAFLSGVEPLDFGYDSPDALWASMARVASAAEADPDLAPQIPSGGLMQALKTVVARLEAQPVKVTVRSPAGAEDIVVPVGADDLRLLLTSLSLGQRRPLENLAHWPRFILELHRGDYRYLAGRTAQSRARERSEALILPLLNHSIGIGARRAARLKAEPAARWLGDLNLKESITRTVAPTRQVDDAFRIDAPIRTPVLLLSGDYDWSTPVENAQHLADFLPNGRHVVVKGGRHCGETNFGEVAVQSPEALDRLYGFLDADFQRTPPKSFLASLPSEIVLKPIDFAPVADRSLYDEWLSNRR